MLANVLLRTEDAGLKLTATNLEIGITYWVPGKIETDGAITVPARLFAEIVDGLPAERAGRPRAPRRRPAPHPGRPFRDDTCAGIDADEFPAIPAAGERPTTRISQKVLRRALSEVTFAAASDEARPILTGVLTRFEGDRAHPRGGRQLPDRDHHDPDPRRRRGDEHRRPRPLVRRARARPRRHGRPGRGHPLAQKNQVLFHVEGIDVVSRLIDGQFPNYQQVLPDEPRHPRRGRPRRPPQGGPPRGATSPARPPTSSSSRSPRTARRRDPVAAAAEVGDHRGVVDATIEGDGTTIAFNARYLSDVLQNVDADRFAIELNGPLSPGVFRPADGRDYTHVVMPVRTTS